MNCLATTPRAGPPISPEHLTLYWASIRFDERSDEGI